MSINRVILSGTLTREAELRNTASVSILSFSMAVNDRKKNAQGEWVDVPNYVGCVMFGTRAEKLASRLLKGVKVCVEGKLHWSQWENKNGDKRSKLEVIVDDIELMVKHGQTQGAQQQQAQAQTPPSYGQEEWVPVEEQSTLAYDDIPF